MKFFKLPFNKLILFSNKEINYMTNSSRRRNLEKGMGHSGLILYIRISKEIFAYDGWDLMK
jgi:hypothetical protein